MCVCVYVYIKGRRRIKNLRRTKMLLKDSNLFDINIIDMNCILVLKNV